MIELLLFLGIPLAWVVLLIAEIVLLIPFYIYTYKIMQALRVNYPFIYFDTFNAQPSVGVLMFPSFYIRKERTDRWFWMNLTYTNKYAHDPVLASLISTRRVIYIVMLVIAFLLILPFLFLLMLLVFAVFFNSAF